MPYIAPKSKLEPKFQKHIKDLIVKSDSLGLLKYLSIGNQVNEAISVGGVEYIPIKLAIEQGSEVFSKIKSAFQKGSIFIYQEDNKAQPSDSRGPAPGDLIITPELILSAIESNNLEALQFLYDQKLNIQSFKTNKEFITKLKGALKQAVDENKLDIVKAVFEIHKISASDEFLKSVSQLEGMRTFFTDNYGSASQKAHAASIFKTNLETKQHELDKDVKEMQAAVEHAESKVEARDSKVSNHITSEDTAALITPPTLKSNEMKSNEMTAPVVATPLVENNLDAAVKAVDQTIPLALKADAPVVTAPKIDVPLAHADTEVASHTAPVTMQQEIQNVMEQLTPISEAHEASQLDEPVRPSSELAGADNNFNSVEI